MDKNSTEIVSNIIDNYSREYEKIINNAKLDGIYHPGRVYVTLRDLYSPVLYLGQEEYASHLPPIPGWLWEEIKKTAEAKYEYQSTRRKNRMHIAEEQVQMWKSVMDGNPPYRISLSKK